MTELNPSYSEYIKGLARPTTKKSGFSYLIARVTHVVQGPFLIGTNILDKYYKGPNDIGTITFQLIPGPQSRTLASAGNALAKPMASAFKQLPVEGELVLLFPGPGVAMNDARGARDFYYTNSYNLWNSNHHNAFPEMGDYGEYVKKVKRSYRESEQVKQAINTTVTGSLTMPLGPDFVEKSNVKKLREFTGDTIVEGRWGNSIRLGSTSVVRESNNWSKEGNFGNPITIIRNGQGRPENDIPWFPTVEDINRDPSSIYLTEGQEIIINDISTNFSLASLQVALQPTVTTAVEMQQQLTSIDTISPMESDRKTSQ